MTKLLKVMIQMIKHARRRKLLSQNDLAQMLKVDQSYISKLENGRANCIHYDFLFSISSILDLDPGKLLIWSAYSYRGRRKKYQKR